MIGILYFNICCSKSAFENVLTLLLIVKVQVGQFLRIRFHSVLKLIVINLRDAGKANKTLLLNFNCLTEEHLTIHCLI